MGANEDFFSGLKSEADRDKEWTDAAEFFVGLRRGPQEEVSPEPEIEKQASIGDHARMVWDVAKRVDPTGVARVATGSKAGLATALGGAAVMGLGTGLMSRPSADHGGKSALEDELQGAKKHRAQGPEPRGFVTKLKNNFSDLTADLATTARKHPVKAGLAGALGGATVASRVFQALKGKAK
jgi:hypothetical protein